MNGHHSQPAILASDAEREHAVVQLREAVVEGRLTLEEFAARVGLAQAARTDRELAELSRDLPSGRVQAGVIAGVDRHLALCSRLERRGPWELPRCSVYRSVFGTIDLDLSQARIAGAETELEIHNVFGTVTVTVPEGIEVSVSGGGAFASQVIEPPVRAPAAGAPRLRVRVRGPGGTLYVRASRRQPGPLARLLGRS